MADGFLAQAPIYENMEDYEPNEEESQCHGVVGGFPCQVPWDEI